MIGETVDHPQVGGEPHCRTTAFRFGDGLSRISWKDMSGRGSLDVRQVLSVVNLRLTRNCWGEAPERLERLAEAIGGHHTRSVARP